MTKLEPTRTSSDLTATERLRELLDERGVEYEALNRIITMWTGDVCSWIAIEDKDGLAVAVNRDDLTPEQAVAATLGVETCHIVKASRKYVLSDGTELFEDGCSVCNGYIGEGDNYCPNCGRRIEVDE